jgi:hypothetical protein
MVIEKDNELARGTPDVGTLSINNHKSIISNDSQFTDH